MRNRPRRNSSAALLLTLHPLEARTLLSAGTRLALSHSPLSAFRHGHHAPAIPAPLAIPAGTVIPCDPSPLTSDLNTGSPIGASGSPIAASGSVTIVGGYFIGGSNIGGYDIASRDPTSEVSIPPPNGSYSFIFVNGVLQIVAQPTPAIA